MKQMAGGPKSGKGSYIESRDQALLTVAEMAQADQMTIRSGISGAELMEAAGLAVVRHITGRYGPVKTLVLCGPGNNGGDGFVVARHLKDAGWDVELALLGERKKLSGDAARMAAKWPGPLLDLGPDVLAGHGLIVDAIFGAGLCRPITGATAELIERINRFAPAVVAVDVPSGVEGDSGQIRGAGLNAASTVTFFRKKPGHLLLPGRTACGEVVVSDIGILPRVLVDIQPQTHCNGPALWRGGLPRWRDPAALAAIHKYDRGHAVVISGGPAAGGAARLAARAALRIGAGLVSLSCPEAAVTAHAAQLDAVMIKPFEGRGDIAGLLKDDRLNSWCVGPGNGVTAQTRSHVLSILAAGRHAVIDADGLTVFADRPESLFSAIRQNTGGAVVLTPHDGEFSRLFPDLSRRTAGYDKLDAARQAAARAGAVVVLKGPDTVVAAPDGRAVINDNAPPDLATAGAGDVLSGLISGLLAQGMPAFPAAAAAVWIHGAAAAAFGPGLISEDIEGRVPGVLRGLCAAED